MKAYLSYFMEFGKDKLILSKDYHKNYAISKSNKN